MTTAGYSGTPLWRKLGITADSRVVALGAPEDFRQLLGALPAGADVMTRIGSADIFIVFSTDSEEMERRFTSVLGVLPANGAIWTAWPKRSSGVATDITENVLRETFLRSGMVDNKVCAIDATWSGLRFVVRRENRTAWDPPGDTA